MRPLKISLLAFESAVLQSDIPVLLIFGAEWDQKSRYLFDQLDRIAEIYDKKLKVCKVDYDYVPDIFSECQVYEIPTMMIIEDGEVFDKKSEYHEPRDLQKFIDHFFGVLPY